MEKSITPLSIASGLLILFISLSSCTRDEKPAEPADGKTAQQIISEYKYWSGIKNDWANLGYYMEENKELKPPATGEHRVVFMGNSITIGWILENPGFFEGKPYVNRGISGQTTPQMLVRFRQDVIDLNPEVAVLLCGVNDIAGNTGPSTLEMIEGNIASMAELAKTNGIKVILCSVLPALDFPWRPGLEPAEKIIALNDWIKTYALRNDFIYLDYYSSMVNEKNGLKAEYSEDGVHPNKTGYLVMEELVEKAIGEAIGKR